MLDSFGRNISYLRISVTERCNLRCVYCVPTDDAPRFSGREPLGFDAIASVVDAAYGLGVRKFRLTGGEPLVRDGVPVLVSMMRSAAPDAELSMTTNGTLLSRFAADLGLRGLNSVNVSLDTLDAARYAELTGGGRLSDALEGIEAAQKAGLRVKINTVVLEDGKNEGVEAVRRWASDRGADFQRIREYRLDEPKRDDDRYERPPKCVECNRIRLSSDGVLFPCLHSDIRIPLDLSDPASSLRACVLAKPICGGARTRHAVNTIGG